MAGKTMLESVLERFEREVTRFEPELGEWGRWQQQKSRELNARMLLALIRSADGLKAEEKKIACDRLSAIRDVIFDFGIQESINDTLAVLRS
jgi:hypothetical protein